LSVRVLVELSPTLDTREWPRLHALGLVADRFPYGLDRLADHGFKVMARTAPRLRAIDLVSRAGAKLTAGARWPESVLGNPSPAMADVRLCWDERTGIPAVLTRPGGRRHRAVVSGAIWLSEPDAKLSAFARWTVKSALQRTDAIFVLSSGQISPLRERWGMDTTRIHLVHFGVDTEFWSPSPAFAEDEQNVQFPWTSPSPPEEPGHPAVVSVGNDRHRAHDLLLAAFRDVHNKLPEARLDLVTSTPSQVPAEVGRWHQSLTHPQLRALYRTARVVVVSTRLNNHVSGITAILEAMAMGKPVVATKTPGLEEYVADGKTGVLVSVGDRDAMAKALIELLNDPGRCAQLGSQARKRVLIDFSTSAQAHRLANVLRSVT
jgi:glycosyltransferase involved in cell wall biosynthesis